MDKRQPNLFSCLYSEVDILGMGLQITNQILFLLAGLILFLFGMVKLSVKMQSVFSARIRKYIKHSVRKPIYGVILGTVATFLFQSSSATTVMVVGMVSAGLISFFNSLGVILGSDIGTTFTAQLVAWKITAISPIFIIIGGILWIVAKKERLKIIGEAIFYFGLIFFGLHLISQVTAPLKNNQFFINLFLQTANPFFGIIIGLVVTAMVHASAIPISILVILGQQGLVSIEGALPIVLGANIGTTATALMASIGANVSGRRSAFAHFLFKFFGVIIFLPFFNIFIQFLKNFSQNPAQQIVAGHFLFNVFIVCIFIFFLKPFSSFVKKIIPGEEKFLPIWPEWLDEKTLNNVPEAFESVKKELKRQAILAREMFGRAIQMTEEFGDIKLRDLFYIEFVVDNLQSEIAGFLSKLSKMNLEKKETVKLFDYAAMVDDIERMADHTINIAKLSKLKKAHKAPFSESAQQEIREIQELVAKNLEDAISLIEKPRDEERIKDIMAREEIIDKMVSESKQNHMERFYKGICHSAAGPIFIDILINLERISDHCVNIAEYAQDFED